MLKEDESIERKIDRREIVYWDDYVIFGYRDEETGNKLNKFFYKQLVAICTIHVLKIWLINTRQYKYEGF